MKNVVVTGGCGFIGGHVVECLLEAGYKVIVIDNHSTNNNPHHADDATYYHTDLREQATWDSILTKFGPIDCAFHLAAYPRVQPSIDNPLLFHECNVNTTVSLLETCRQNGIRKIVFSSSSSIYGTPAKLPVEEHHAKQPMSPYALHKLIGEQYLYLYFDLYGISSISLRYFNVYGDRYPTEGPYVPVVGIFLKQKADNKPLTVTGDGEQSRDFIYVKDVARANLLSCQAMPEGVRSYNVGSGNGTKVIDIAKYMSNDIQFVPPRHEYKDARADITEIQKDLGWSPQRDLFDWIDQQAGVR
jgi:UDP-glucose 4-epimerase